MALLTVAEGTYLLGKALAGFAPGWQLTCPIAHVDAGRGHWIHYSGLCQFHGSITDRKTKFKKLFGMRDSDPPGKLITPQPYSCHPAIPCARLIAYRDGNVGPIKNFIEVEIHSRGKRGQT
jgi:hypothetical protein